MHEQRTCYSVGASTSACSGASRSARRLVCPPRVHRLLRAADPKTKWEQNAVDVYIRVPVDDRIRRQDVKFEFLPVAKRLSLKVAGATMLEGSLDDVDGGWSWELEKQEDQQYVVLRLGKKTLGTSWEMLLEADRIDTSFTNRVFLDVSIGGKPAGRILIGLFYKAAPKTVANFSALCTDGIVGKSGKKLTYKGSRFHRIIPGVLAQGGDITLGDGRGGKSIYGKVFEDENLEIEHEVGYVAMANTGPNTNNSQFYITFDKRPELDGTHVVFGRVEQGMDVVRQMEAVGTPEGTPASTVEVTECGEIEVDEPDVQPNGVWRNRSVWR